MSTILKLNFALDDGKEFAVIIDEPLSSVDETNVKEFMQTIIDEDIFRLEGMPLTQIVGAMIIKETSNIIF